MTPMLILPPRYTDDTNLMRRAALAQGWGVERLTRWRLPEGWSVAPEACVFYGEPLFAAVVADQLGLALYEPTLDWLADVPREFLGREVRAMTLAEAQQIEHEAFIKPADDKCFVAKVYASGAELGEREDLDADEVVTLVSEPVAWLWEVRCFVEGGQVRAHSVYMREGELAEGFETTEEESERALEMAQRVLAEVEVPPGVVLDVGCLGDGTMAVVEANPAWGSGVYGCETAEVLPVLAACVCDAASVPPELKRWVREV